MESAPVSHIRIAASHNAFLKRWISPVLLADFFRIIKHRAVWPARSLAIKFRPLFPHYSNETSNAEVYTTILVAKKKTWRAREILRHVLEIPRSLVCACAYRADAAERLSWWPSGWDEKKKPSGSTIYTVEPEWLIFPGIVAAMFQRNVRP